MNTSKKIVWQSAAVAAATFLSAGAAHADHWNESRNGNSVSSGGYRAPHDEFRLWRAHAFRQLVTNTFLRASAQFPAIDFPAIVR